MHITSPHLSGFVWHGGLKAPWSYLRYEPATSFRKIVRYWPSSSGTPYGLNTAMFKTISNVSSHDSTDCRTYLAVNQDVGVESMPLLTLFELRKVWKIDNLPL